MTDKDQPKSISLEVTEDEICRDLYYKYYLPASKNLARDEDADGLPGDRFRRCEIRTDRQGQRRYLLGEQAKER